MGRIMKKILEKFQNNYFVYVAVPLLLHYKKFRKTYKFLQKSQWWSQEELNEYQLNQLDKLLKHAYKNVPYYKKIFDDQNLKPSDIQDFKDLQKIPFLSKEIVRKNLNDLKANNYPKYKFEYISTGGSTGIPLGFYVEKNIWFAEELAYSKILLNRVNCDFKDRFVYLREFVISSADKGKLWKYSLFGRCLILSSYHLSEVNLSKYIEIIRSFKPKFIVAYPSSIIIIARYMKRNNIEPIKTVKAILVGAEKLYDWQRCLIEETFVGCRLLDYYGNAERAVLSSTCEKSCYHHIFPQYGIIELIDKNGKPVTEEDKPGEIVATGFNNFIFPFIRYKTGDVGVFTSRKCSCGLNYSMLKVIEGRLQEYIITKNNRPISMTALNMHSNVFDNVKQFQFYQEKKGQVVLNIVRYDNYTEKDTKYIKRELYKKIGDDINLSIQFVDEIPRTMRGKRRFLIQKLPTEIENLR